MGLRQKTLTKEGKLKKKKSKIQQTLSFNPDGSNKLQTGKTGKIRQSKKTKKKNAAVIQQKSTTSRRPAQPWRGGEQRATEPPAHQRTKDNLLLEGKGRGLKRQNRGEGNRTQV